VIPNTRPCEGCGCPDLDVDETYAAVEDSSEVEVLVWRCDECGRRTETTRQVA
jgi:hypothetical protein